jgi:hypothetical protein
MKYLLFIMLAMSSCFSTKAEAAVGCTLSNPAEDLKYLFPEMTTFKEELKNFESLDSGRKLYENLKVRLGSDLDQVYETFETPYNLYLVFKGETLIGVVHGVNVPGKGGVIQVFLSTDPKTGEIRSFFFQRIESPVSKELRKKEFREQFKNLTLADFYKHDYYKSASGTVEQDKLSKIQVPDLSSDGQFDYTASLRGIRKNLILLDMFFYNQLFEPYFIKAQQALAKESKTLGGK